MLSPRTTRVPPRLHPFELEALERSRELEDIHDVSPQSPLDELEEYRSFDSQNASPYTKRRGEDNRRASPFKRRDTDRANKHKANDKIASVEELHASSTSIEILDNIRPSDIASIATQIRKSKENLADNHPMPGPSMTPEASKCLEEEFQILDEQIKAITVKSNQLVGSGSIQTLSSTSSSNEIEVISSEDIERKSTTQEFVVVNRHNNNR